MKDALISIFDILFFPIVFLSAKLLFFVRAIGVQRLNLCKKALLYAGVFPIKNHYYEPLFDTEHLRPNLQKERKLPGIKLNPESQIALLSHLGFAEELLQIPTNKTGEHTYFYNNIRFGPGDAELLYSFVRFFKPKQILEIGSGFSTLMVRTALAKNSQEDPIYSCDHICIEPYEEPWLESCGATVIRKKVEELDFSIFEKLERNDILFIDSSHMIRPYGDVLYEFLEILPRLASGVLVHVHDIFTPRDYPAAWVCDEVRFWNEQYLLEAFLSHSDSFEVVCALNYLKHNYPNEISRSLPILGKDSEREPGSFWIRRL